MRRDLAVAAGPVLVLWAIGAAVFFSFPPPWPDETLFAEPARALLHEGRLATRTMEGLLPGAAERTYWVPPLYLVWLAGWFAAFGESLGVMRGASLGAAAAALVLATSLARRVLPDSRPSLLLVVPALLALDPLFVRAAVIGRMEGLTLALSLAALRCALSPSPARSRIAIAGVLSGLATICHPMGLVSSAAIGAALVGVGIQAPRKGLPTLVAFGAGWLAGVAPWLVYIAADPSTFAAQFQMQFQRKAQLDLFERWRRFMHPDWHGGVAPPLRVVGLALALGGLSMACRRRPVLAALPIAAAIFAGLVVWSGEYWYTVYLVPFTAIGVAYLAGVSRARPAVLVLVAVLGTQSAVRDAQAIAAARRTSFPAWVEALDREVISRLPPGTIVMCNAIPDPSAALLHVRPHLRWRQFPPVTVDDAAYLRWLSEVEVFVLGPIAPDPRVGDWLATEHPGWPATTVAAGGYEARLVRRENAR